MSYRTQILAAVIATLTFSSAALAEVSLPAGFGIETVAGPEVVSEPMEMAFGPDGAAWVTGRAGQIWRIDTTTRAAQAVGSVPTDVSGDRGLHGIAFHPDFPRTPHLFLAYHLTNAPKDKYVARVSRWTVTGSGAASRIDPGSEKSLVEWEGDQAGQHVGGALLAHPTERVLYVTTGENNQNANLRKYCDDPDNKAQSLGDPRGKVLRIGFDGSVPKDNPHVQTAGADPRVYTRGHRQPWSLTYDAPTGLLLAAENGGDLSDDHDEVNRIVPGANFGWPKVFGPGLQTLTRTNHVDGFTDPWFHYPRNTGASCVGALIYRASASGHGFPEKYRGALFYADFARKSSRTASVNPKTGKPGSGEAFLQGLPAGPLAMQLGKDGAVYFITHGGATKGSTNDSLARIVWKQQ
jgi:glucose/arabinose dehydrogenase